MNDKDLSSTDVWDALQKVALEDGVITQEERILISNIVLDVEAYSNMVDRALEDGIISKNERVELFEGRIEILEKAYHIAREDRSISNDETELLKSIVKMILSIEKKN
ncbi:MAG: hypothetical protein HeimC2_22020 [Candidatus Heimdallarchaeota archaeon LC_2]|nr:MAG: hypothetical protein HeimC2_22020 [Candidatus Heimdallarchaeota archaeon LC_2]